MSKLGEKIHDDTSTQMFNDNIASTVNEISSLLINNAKKLFSDEKYTDGMKLSIGWLPTHEIKAHASINNQNKKEHYINFSYGLIHNFYKDSMVFSRLCGVDFKDHLFDEYFIPNSYGNKREDVIPESLFSKFDKSIDIKSADLKFEIQLLFNEFLLTWLYLHEQSHLFQYHSIVENEYFNSSSNAEFLNIHEYSVESSNKLSEEEAWVSHAFELSADHEALYLSMQYIMKKTMDMYGKEEISLDLFWVFICCIGYVFEKFYGIDRDNHNGIAKGTHPNPDIRLKLMIEHIINFLKNKYVIKHYEKGKTLDDYRSVLNHALKTIQIFFKVTYTQDDVFVPKFQINFYENTDMDYKYLNGINDKWKKLRPIVMKYYFGYGNSQVMPLYDMPTL